MSATATKQQPATTIPKPTPSRMTLSSLVRGKQARPIRATVHGPEGVGKTTFAAGAPSPVFLDAEDGSGQLDVVRFPALGNWSELLEAINVLTMEKHDHQTLVVDTLDWAERLLWDFICKRDGKSDIEEYGYGKGFQVALAEWTVFLAALDRLRKAKDMHVVLIAHSWIKPFKNPEGEDYDRYELKLNAKAGGLIKEWSDAVLFANYETISHQDKRTKRVRGLDTGARFIHTERSAAFDAKNRYDLPESLPLSWSDFEFAVRAGRPANPDALISEIQRKAKLLIKEDEKRALEAIKRANGDATKLAQLNDWANAKLAAKEETND
jgi:hypothetical protein